MSYFDTKDPLKGSQPKSTHHPEPSHDQANLFIDKLTQGCETIKEKLGLDHEIQSKEEQTGVKNQLQEALTRAEEKLQDKKADINYEPRVNQTKLREYRQGEISVAPQSSISSSYSGAALKQTPENQGMPLGMTKGDMLGINPQ